MAIRTNYASNPSAEGNLVIGWGDFAGTGALTQDAVEFLYGTKSAKYVAANAGAFEGIGPGTLDSLGWTGEAESVTSSIYLKGTGSLNICGHRVYYADATMQDEDGGFTQGIVFTGSWVRYEFHVTLNPAKVVDYIQLILVNSVAAANTFYADGFMVERTDTLQDYFDGDTADGGGFVYDWTGTPNASTSTRDAVPSGSGIIIPLFAGRRRRR